MASEAIEVAARLHGRPGRVVLHSGQDDDGCGRYSFVAADPLRTIAARGRRVVVRDARGRVERDERTDPIAALSDLLRSADQEAVALAEPLPLAIGYLGYDLGREIESLPSVAARDRNAPDLWFGFYGAVWRRDEGSGRSEVIGRDSAAVARLQAALADGPRDLGRPPRLGELVCDVSDADYRAAVERLLAYIRAGDVYQANLARRLTAPIVGDGDALALYQAVLRAAPCAFGGIIETPEVRLVSGSPERFLYRPPRSRRLETRPIKGTRRRPGEPTADRAAAAELAADEKECAEHLMIVDLERNDLGRVARPGTVSVDSYARVVELPTLYHLVSTVSCEVADGRELADVLRATFPGGSITGAPKVRAMEIIDELEPCRRGPYTGAFGYFGAGGAMDLAIAIRTAVLGDGVLDLHVGGGIVADSSPARELAETEVKAAAWRSALRACRV